MNNASGSDRRQDPPRERPGAASRSRSCTASAAATTNHHEYCSRVCCMYALKFAHLVKEKTERRGVPALHRPAGVRQGLRGVLPAHPERGRQRHPRQGAPRSCRPRAPGARRGSSSSAARTRWPARSGEIPVDMVILCTALEARADAKADRRGKFGISVGADGFFIERHPKLGPVSTTTDGIFIAGACQGPKDIPDTVAQGGAAAAHAMSLIGPRRGRDGRRLRRGRREAAAAAAGCATTSARTPPSTSTRRQKVSRGERGALQGAAATCVAGCPSGAIRALHFTDEQIFAEIEGMLA